MNRLLRIVYLSVALCLLSMINHPPSTGSEGDSIRITADELKGMLGRSDLVVMDVRDPINWSKSDRRIPGAVREDSENVSAWAASYSKEKMIVLYCA